MPRHVVILGPVSPEQPSGAPATRPAGAAAAVALASPPSPSSAPVALGSAVPAARVAPPAVEAAQPALSPALSPSPAGVSSSVPSLVPGLTMAPAGGRDRRRRRRTRWPVPVLAALGLMAGLLMQLGSPAPQAALVLLHTAPVTIGGSAPALPWPAAGEAAVSVPAAGVTVSPVPGVPVPIASLTKMMTALVVLRDHPLSASAAGPEVTMTLADQQDAAADSAHGDTGIPVTAGETLSERQLLDGLLVHSANDFADALATWDAGSLAAFVAKMNTTATSMGMAQTHYVDPNGIGAGDVSTPRDQLQLASVAMTIPAFAAVVAQPTIVSPGAGLLANYISEVGTRGVVGVKSGFTQAAMGCVVLAAERQVDGQQVLVMAAVTGQQGFNALDVAAQGALALIDAAASGLHMRTLVPAGQRQGSITASWTHRRPALLTGAAVTVPVWPGTRWTTRVTTRQLGGDVKVGEVLGTLTVSDGGRAVSVPLVSNGQLRQPSRSWRIVHSS